MATTSQWRPFLSYSMARTETQTVRQEGLPQAVSVLQTSRLATLLHKSTNLSREIQMVFSLNLQIINFKESPFACTWQYHHMTKSPTAATS